MQGFRVFSAILKRYAGKNFQKSQFTRRSAKVGLTMGIAAINPLLERTYIPPWAIVLSFGFAGFVGICFGMFPAIKAARLDPIEALRHE